MISMAPLYKWPPPASFRYITVLKVWICMSILADYVLAETVIFLLLFLYFISLHYEREIYIEKQSDSIVHVGYRNRPTQA